jgi:hypothetical protein
MAPRALGRLHKATISYGYGLSRRRCRSRRPTRRSATAACWMPPTFVRGGAGEGRGDRPAARRTLMDMLETVTGPAAPRPARARAGYRVAGKTGTSRKAAPAATRSATSACSPAWCRSTNPRFSMVVVINDPPARLLRRPGRGAGVRPGDGRRAAPPRRAAGRHPGGRAGGRRRAGAAALRATAAAGSRGAIEPVPTPGVSAVSRAAARRAARRTAARCRRCPRSRSAGCAGQPRVEPGDCFVALAGASHRTACASSPGARGAAPWWCCSSRRRRRRLPAGPLRRRARPARAPGRSWPTAYGARRSR